MCNEEELTRLRAEVETLTDSNASKADRLDRLGETVVKMRAEVEALRAALQLLFTEAELAGFSTANDYGWPKAMTTARAALGQEVKNG
jgi:predicted nuclease with TOPRIM domain